MVTDVSSRGAVFARRAEGSCVAAPLRPFLVLWDGSRTVWGRKVEFREPEMEIWV